METGVWHFFSQGETCPNDWGSHNEKWTTTKNWQDGLRRMLVPTTGFASLVAWHYRWMAHVVGNTVGLDLKKDNFFSKAKSKMTSSTYLPPVNQLFTLGKPKFGLPNWFDYRSMGLTEEHVPELIRMAIDMSLHESEEQEKEVWAPIHAWRALAQLKAESAIPSLVSLIEPCSLDLDDWALLEFPHVFRLIGDASTEPVIAFLKEEKHELFARITAMEILEEIGGFLPDSRGKCIAALTSLLKNYKTNDCRLNAALASALSGMYARESLPLIKQVYRAGYIDADNPYWEMAMENFDLSYEKDEE